MRSLLTLVAMISWAVFSMAQTNTYWNENTAFRLASVAHRRDGSFEVFNVRLSNSGPDSLYFFLRVGNFSPASISVEKLVNGKWQDIRTLGDVRARCSSPLYRGNSVTVPVSVDSHALLEGDKPTKIRFGLVVYRSSEECNEQKNGRSVFSFPETYSEPN